ncbi:hypothetical protein AALO_G00148370 [Alosa alosa]|uniref:Uncharacterized protein n=1 Tax=Alosa alosa TaxID=278164 RepID=A0AAV6GDN2_9TELE|nr:hypothetical protein AALO_G00148370 [Alosa alosa]
MGHGQLELQHKSAPVCVFVCSASTGGDIHLQCEVWAVVQTKHSNDHLWFSMVTMGDTGSYSVVPCHAEHKTRKEDELPHRKQLQQTSVPHGKLLLDLEWLVALDRFRKYPQSTH